MANTTSILIVDDNVEFCDDLKHFLGKYGFQVYVANDANQALELAKENDVNLIILDMLFPDANGINICKDLRTILDIPIIIVSGLNEDMDRIASLEVGADCYLNKPIEPRYLMAQINACLRRHQDKKEQVKPKVEVSSGKSNIYRFADCELSCDTHKLHFDDGKTVMLTFNEYKVLLLLLKKPRFIFSRDAIMNQLDFELDKFDRAIDVLICRLRAKVKKYTSIEGEIIKTIRGCGYMLDCDVTQE